MKYLVSYVDVNSGKSTEHIFPTQLSAKKKIVDMKKISGSFYNFNIRKLYEGELMNPAVEMHCPCCWHGFYIQATDLKKINDCGHCGALVKWNEKDNKI